jgi:hypothetical protein
MLAFKDHNYMHVGRYVKSLKGHLKTYKFELDTLTKCDIINLLVKCDKWNPELQILSQGILKTVYFMMLENLSLFFYKCEDPIYILEKCAHLSQENDFWISVEDLLMRSKKDYSIEQLSRICLMYAKISQGSNVFWQEIEDLLMVKSASFKNDSSNALVNVITSFSMQGR